MHSGLLLHALERTTTVLLQGSAGQPNVSMVSVGTMHLVWESQMQWNGDYSRRTLVKFYPANSSDAYTVMEHIEKKSSLEHYKDRHVTHRPSTSQPNLYQHVTFSIDGVTFEGDAPTVAVDTLTRWNLRNLRVVRELTTLEFQAEANTEHGEQAEAEPVLFTVEENRPGVASFYVNTFDFRVGTFTEQVRRLAPTIAEAGSIVQQHWSGHTPYTFNGNVVVGRWRTLLRDGNALFTDMLAKTSGDTIPAEMVPLVRLMQKNVVPLVHRLFGEHEAAFKPETREFHLFRSIRSNVSRLCGMLPD